jgi:hypothetical protein
MSFMRRLIAFALIAAATPVSAQLILPPQEDERAPSRLVPLDRGSAWYERFEPVGVTLGIALAGGPGGGWPELFGDKWLSVADRTRITALLADESGALHRVLAKSAGFEQVVLGWQPAEGGAAYADLIKDRPEADAIICWRDAASKQPWPTTVVEAEDHRRHACVRISYSIRFDPPQWRAFIDAPVVPAS